VSPIRTFIQRPIFTSMLVLALVVFGLRAFPSIGVDQTPKVDIPVVTINTVLKGADPETIEKNVSKPLEEELNAISGLDTISSYNYENVSVIVLEFKLEKNIDVAAQEARDKVNASLSKLPTEIDTPVVQKLDLQAQAIVQLALTGPLPVETLTKAAKDEIRPALQRVAGVGTVDVVGGRERQIAIRIDPSRLRSYGLAANDVPQAISAQSIDIPGGRTLEPGKERVVKLETEAKSVDEIRDLVLASPGGRPIRVKDVAEVVDGPEEARSAARLDGQPAIALVVKKQSDANTTAVAEGVKEHLAEIQKLLPAGSQLSVVNDNSRFIRKSIESVQHDLFIGAILAVLVVLLFLRNFRATIVAAFALPTSIIGAFAAIKALDFTFNQITMLALTLSIGLLIDDAIVVIENVFRHLERKEPPRQAALAGTTQIALAVLAVTLSVIAVFVPVAFMGGIAGRFFFQFGITVALAVALSYLVSMTLTPMLSARLLSHGESMGAVGRLLERGFQAVESLYRRLLRWALDHRWITVGLTVGVFALTIFLGRYLSTTFMPTQDTSELQVTLEMPLGTPLADADRAADDVSRQVRSFPGVASVFALTGGGTDGAVNKAVLTVNLVPIAERRFKQEEMKAYLRKAVQLPHGAIFTVGERGWAGGRSQPVQFNIRSNDPALLAAAVEKGLAAMRSDPGFADVDSSYRVGSPIVSVRVERDRAAAVGLPAAQIGGMLRAFLGQQEFAKYREKGDQYDIVLRLPDAVRADPESLGGLTLRTPRGELVELRSVADLVRTTGPSEIDRGALKRQVTLLADLRGMSMGEANKKLEALARAFPPGVQTGFAGQSKFLGETMGEFVKALLLGVILIYMVLCAQFESLLDPLTIMVSLPLSAIGAIAALLIAQQYMSIFAMIGMIMLMGLVAKNGILIVEFTNQLREQGRHTRDALLEAGPMRLRPILMTSVAMIAGMLPVAFARGDGAESRTGMAWAIIGGLAASTVLTLVVVPVIYSLMDRFRRHHAGRHEGDREAEERSAA
jgi:hydrophobic/amphiphilic exporter-1 (mainly G- bacteria), HAE1 family